MKRRPIQLLLILIILLVSASYIRAEDSGWYVNRPGLKTDIRNAENIVSTPGAILAWRKYDIEGKICFCHVYLEYSGCDEQKDVYVSLYRKYQCPPTSVFDVVKCETRALPMGVETTMGTTVDLDSQKRACLIITLISIDATGSAKFKIRDALSPHQGKE